jgi:hypothetical protein
LKTSDLSRIPVNRLFTTYAPGSISGVLAEGNGMPRRALRKVRLTALKIRNAKARGGAELIIWDEVQRGLGLRVQPTGGKSWYCVYSR